MGIIRRERVRQRIIVAAGVCVALAFVAMGIRAQTFHGVIRIQKDQPIIIQLPKQLGATPSNQRVIILKEEKKLKWGAPERKPVKMQAPQPRAIRPQQQPVKVQTRQPKAFKRPQKPIVVKIPKRRTTQAPQRPIVIQQKRPHRMQPIDPRSLERERRHGQRR